MVRDMREKPCLFCEGKEYRWGHMSGYPGHVIHFYPRESGLRQLPANLVGKDSQKIVVRECLSCHNLQFFSNRE